jgi:hypothetical protein|nr:MAG TPA: hypothetical protein [Bacteriophage sp.]
MNVVNYYPRLLNRAVNLVSQLYNGEIKRNDFDNAWKRIGNQIEHEKKLKN